MKKNAKTGLFIGLIFLVANAFGQSENAAAEGTRNTKPAESHLDLLLNVVGTNLNYGKSNSALADYKKSVLSPQVGVSMQLGITPNFSVATELYFIMKGARLESNNPLTNSKTTLRFYTVELPLMARFHFNKFYVNAGPSIAYSLYGTNKVEDKTSDLSFGSSGNSFKRWEAGMQFGGGYNFRIKKRHVALDLRYNYGLTNISNANEMYNRSFVLNVRFYKPWKTNPLSRNKNS